jgi:uncharacterized protein (DUF58 family)
LPPRCTLLALSAVQNNDKVGLVLFTDDVELYLPPAKGKKHVLRVAREILYYEPRGRGTNLAAALDHLSRAQKRRAVVFVLSDFLDTGFDRSLAVASRRHDVVALRLRDDREERLPNVGVIAVEDLETGKTMLVDTGSGEVRRAFGRAVAEAEERFEEIVRSARIDHVDLWTDEDVVQPLAGFFRKRMRRLGR